MDRLFTVKVCDRCGKPFNGAKIMSMFNTDIICMSCKDAERNHPDYEKAVKADIVQIKKGNYNFEGIGYKEVK